MRNLFTKFRKNQQGNATVLVAAAMVAFCAVMALVADAGTLYVEKAKLSQGADAAVLAASQDLPRSYLEALWDGYGYAYLNGVSFDKISFNISADNRVITAQASSPVRFIFSRVFGINNGRTSADATVRIGNVSAVKGVVPLGIVEDNYQYGMVYTLKEGGGSGDTGWYGTLALNGEGARIYEYNLTYGTPITIRVGEVVNTEAGNVSGPTQDAIQFRIDQCNHQPRCSASYFVPDCPRILKVPIIRPIIVNGFMQQVLVVGFGAFLVDSCSGNGNESIISGSFIQYVTDGETSADAPDYGLYTARMID